MVLTGSVDGERWEPMGSLLPRCTPLPSWPLLNRGAPHQKRVSLALSARSNYYQEGFRLQGAFITGELEVTSPEPRLGLKQAFSALKTVASFKSVIALILVCTGHSEFMTKKRISQ